MNGQPSTPVEPVKAKKSHTPAGVWMVYAEQNGGFVTITPNTSEIATLRLAMATGKKAIFVPFGTSLDEAVGARTPVG